MRDLDIGEVRARSGLPPSTLRYYEQRGLIAPSRRAGLRRQYDPSVIERLALITLGRAAGFSLDEIAGMIGADGAPRLDRAALADKADAVDETITRLSLIRDGLRHAAACPAPRHVDCPSFQRLLRAAAVRLMPPADDAVRALRPRAVRTARRR
ncbi:MAG: helix-turn-helix domain-containing protein [Pseudomonadota bacterium]